NFRVPEGAAEAFSVLGRRMYAIVNGCIFLTFARLSIELGLGPVVHVVEGGPRPADTRTSGSCSSRIGVSRRNHEGQSPGDGRSDRCFPCNGSGSRERERGADSGNGPYVL